MARYMKVEIEMSPHLVKKLFEHVKTPQVTEGDIPWMVSNLIELSKCDEMLTLDEFEMIIKKPGMV